MYINVDVNYTKKLMNLVPLVLRVIDNSRDTIFTRLEFTNQTPIITERSFRIVRGRPVD